MADRFDVYNLNSSSVVQYLDVQKYAEGLYSEANPESAIPKTAIAETSMDTG